MCLQRETSHCSAPLSSIPGKLTVQFPYCDAFLLSTTAGSSVINICHEQLEQGNPPRPAAPGCAGVSQHLEQSPRLVLQLPEQVNALPHMQGLSQLPGNNFVKQRGILKCLGDCGSCQTPKSFQRNVNNNSYGVVPPNIVLGHEFFAVEGDCALH